MFACTVSVYNPFEMRSNVMEFWSFCDSTSSRVENEMKPIELLTVDVEIKRVAV